MQEMKRIFVSDNDRQLAATFCEYFADLINGRINRIGFATLAISGGRTPDMIFSELSNNFQDSVNWQKLLVYWVDERCVPPDDPESNYGRAARLLIDNVEIIPDNVFRIMGEHPPPEEVRRYSELLRSNLIIKNDKPCFDLIMLGVGTDGHTASIFPGQEHLFSTGELVAASVNPATGSKRITLTGPLINNASNIAVIASGHEKKNVISSVLDETRNERIYPVQFVRPEHGSISWFLTRDTLPDQQVIPE